MIEKFSDYEGGYLNEEGEFLFTIKDYELKDSKSGTPMAVFTVHCVGGDAKIYHSLNPKARWTYNKLIKAAMHLNTPEKVNAFELDYETIGNDLVGKQFIADVIKDVYDAEVKVPKDDGTFETTTEAKISYKVDTTSYKEYVE